MGASISRGSAAVRVTREAHESREKAQLEETIAGRLTSEAALATGAISHPRSGQPKQEELPEQL